MNTSIIIALVTVALLFVCVFAGVHISFTLMSLSFVGLFLVTSNLSTALSVLSTTAFNAIRTYTYCVIPPLHAHGHHHGSLWFGWRLV